MLKTCKICGSPFHTYFPMQFCCGYECAEKLDLKTNE